MSGFDYEKVEKISALVAENTARYTAFMELFNTGVSTRPSMSLSTYKVLEDIWNSFPKKGNYISGDTHPEFQAHIKAHITDVSPSFELPNDDEKWGCVLSAADGYFAAKHRTTFGSHGYDLDLIETLCHEKTMNGNSNKMDALHYLAALAINERLDDCEPLLSLGNPFPTILNMVADDNDPYFELQSLRIVAKHASSGKEHLCLLARHSLPDILKSGCHQTLNAVLEIEPELADIIRASDIDTISQFNVCIQHGVKNNILRNALEGIIMRLSQTEADRQAGDIEYAISNLYFDKEERKRVEIRYAIKRNHAFSLLKHEPADIEKEMLWLMPKHLSPDELSKVLSNMKLTEAALNKDSTLGKMVR